MSRTQNGDILYQIRLKKIRRTHPPATPTVGKQRVTWLLTVVLLLHRCMHRCIVTSCIAAINPLIKQHEVSASYQVSWYQLNTKDLALSDSQFIPKIYFVAIVQSSNVHLALWVTGHIKYNFILNINMINIKQFSIYTDTRYNIKYHGIMIDTWSFPRAYSNPWAYWRLKSKPWLTRNCTATGSTT